jgi:hypothetical protein
MNDFQTLFSIIFGIYFATTVATAARFAPFDSTAAVAGDRRAIARLALAFLFLNVLPFVYFLGVLRLLEDHCGPVASKPATAAAVLLAALGGFGIYRVFIAFLMIRRGKMKDRFLFYSAPDDLPEGALREGAAYKQPPEDAIRYGVPPIAIGGLLWLALCIGGFLALK